MKFKCNKRRSQKHYKYSIHEEKKKRVSYSLRMATGLPLESKRATFVDSPIRCFWSSSIAKTIGTDIFTKDPSLSLSELKWSVWRNSLSLMKPPSGVAHPSLSTWTHSTSILESFILGNDKASPFFKSLFDSSTTSSTNFPPSGSIKPDETLSFWLVLALFPIATLTLMGGAKWVSNVLEREWEGKEVLDKRVAMEAIEGFGGWRIMKFVLVYKTTKRCCC